MPRKAKSATGADIAARIGRNIKIVRTRLGITQSQLAEKVSLETITISRIETGVQLPGIDRLEEIAQALQVRLPSLVADSSKKSAFVELLADVISDLPVREQEFLYGFAVTYAQHWRASGKGRRPRKD